MSKNMLLKPRMSEKAYGSAQVLSTYVFDVPMTANKLTVADAVAIQFGVTVENVRVSIAKGKVKKSYQKRSRPIDGKRADVKRAYVRIKAGESINLFGEADEKDDKKSSKKADKKAAKSKEEKK